MKDKPKMTQEEMAKIAELERILKQRQLSVDYLEKVIEIASKEVGFDIKEKYKSLFDKL
jgi:hypothetical protein